MTKFFSIAIKDVKTWVRDPAALGILLAMPAVLILILGSAFGGLSGDATGGGIQVAIVNLDAGSSAEAASSASGASSVLGDEVTAALAENEQLAGLLNISEATDPEAVRADVERGDLPAALIIPEDFSARVNAGESVELEVLRDPGAELSSGIFETVVRAVATEFSRISVVARTAGAAAAQAEGVTPELIGGIVNQAVAGATVDEAAAPIAIEMTEFEEPDAQGEGSLDFFAVSMTSMFLLFASMFGAFSFITEKRELTMSRLLTTPTPGSAFVGGKMLGIFILGILQFGVLYAYTRGVMGVNWGDSVLGTWMMATGEVVAVTGLAVLIAAIAKTERAAGAVGSVLVQIMALIGGVFFPLSILPEWLQPIRYLSVIGWALDGFQAVQYNGAGAGDLIINFAAMIGMAALFFGIGVWRLGADQ